MAFPHPSPGAVPNSSRKRRPLVDLARSSASPSRSNAMATIFNDAALSLQTYSRPSSPNTKRSRIPLSQARNTRFGSINQDYSQTTLQTGSPVRFGTDGQADSPLSTASTYVSHRRAATPAEVPHGLRFPTPLPVSSPSPLRPSNAPEQDQDDQIEYSVLNQGNPTRRASQTPTFNSEDEECHSTHGVPFILPLHPTKPIKNKECSVNEWLEEVLISSSTQSPNTEQRNSQSSPISTPVPKTPNHPRSKLSTIHLTPPTQNYSETPSKPATEDRRISTSSNKENQPPTPSISSAPLRPLTTRFLSAHLSRFGISPPQPSTPKSSTSPARSSHPLKRVPRVSPRRPPRTPPGSLSQPPKRQKAASTGKTKTSPGRVLEPKRTFNILEDETATWRSDGRSETEEAGEEGVLVQLSPEVEVARKGRGRGRGKRDRCASYWDEDIMCCSERAIES